MQNIRKITDDLLYVGCSDRRIQLFESAYPVPDGNGIIPLQSYPKGR